MVGIFKQEHKMIHEKTIIVLTVHLVHTAISGSAVLASPLTDLGERSHQQRCNDLTNWIFFPYNRCIHILFETNETDAMSRSENFQHQLNDSAVYIQSLSHMKNQSIFQRNKSNCESFLILSSNRQAIYALFNSTPTTTRFFPFSRLYFMLPIEANLSTLQKHLYSNALFGYNLIRDVASDKIISIHDLLSETYWRHPPNVTDLSHPFINTSDPSKEFTISIFNCTPLVTYLERTSDDYRKDGLEYRFITSVLKNWKIKFIHQDETQKPFIPHLTMLDELGNRTSQLVMCAIWLNVFHNPKYDLTNYFDYHCNTWICPKPVKLNPATAVYRTLSGDVWLAYAFCFLLVVAVLTKISQLESRLRKVEIISTKFGRCLLEAANTATSHGTVNIPQQLSIQILILSWIFLNLLIGVGYTTIYASRLASPSYTPPVDTVEDFVNQELYWATRHSYWPIRTSLKESQNPSFNKMDQRFVYFETQSQLHEAMRTRKYGVLLTLLQNHKAIDIEVVHDADLWKSFRFMSTCPFSFYTTFALNKHSPYTIIFNANVRRYQESGIIKHWFEELYLSVNWMNTLFEAHEQSSPLRILNLIDVSGGFLVLLFGLCAASIAFLGEWAINNFK